ncbi:hypothetical protein [Paenibacillus sp. FSL L8-0494]|uniref:hypothetical protein n=1 Tax=Paenibacillus sp. FSL L8-0494 TaxID=2975352 RepID=UPI0030F83809
MNLKVIDGIKKDKPDYYTMYSNAFIRCLEKLAEKNLSVLDSDLIERKRLVYYGIKLTNLDDSEIYDYKYLIKVLQRTEYIKLVMSSLTPSELENIFPIEKKYDGTRYEVKDYFYTKNVLNKLDKSTNIGEKINDLLWDYQNWDISLFVVNSMSLVSDIRRSQGQKGLMEEFLDEKNVPYYTMHTDEKGKGYLENSQTGEVTKVQKPKPRYLNIVK